MVSRQNLVLGGIALVLTVLFVVSRLYAIHSSLLFFIDMGRDANVLLDWYQTGRPPLLGPQTSALPFNQSAWYFYLLYPLFLLTHFSAFSAIYTNTLLYVVTFLGLLWACRRHFDLQKLLLKVWFLIIVHPQFIIQNRFVWNPSFVGPMIVISLISFLMLRREWRWWWIAALAASTAASMSFNYSAVPFLIAVCVLALGAFRKKGMIIVAAILAMLVFLNLGTLAFEIRHQFPLTNMMLYQPKLAQTEVSMELKMRDLLRFSLEMPASLFNRMVFGIILVLAGISWWFYHVQNEPRENDFRVIVLVWALTFVITLLIPVTILSHYIFAVLTTLLFVIAMLPRQFQWVIYIIVLGSWLRPTLIQSYFAPARRSVAEMERCFQIVCQDHRQPVFTSVQAGFHPFHAAQEDRFLLRKNGCDVKQLDTQIDQARHMVVVVDDSVYEHNKTAYNELTQFGPSRALKKYHCQDNFSAVLLEKIP